jgi:hypothetical protein
MEYLKKLVFVPGKPFETSVMFVSKAEAYPRVEQLKKAP